MLFKKITCFEVVFRCFVWPWLFLVVLLFGGLSLQFRLFSLCKNVQVVEICLHRFELLMFFGCVFEFDLGCI